MFTSCILMKTNTQLFGLSPGQRDRINTFLLQAKVNEPLLTLRNNSQCKAAYLNWDVSVTYFSRTCHVSIDSATGRFLVYSTTVFQVHLPRTESAKWCDDCKLYRMWKETVMQILWYCPTIFSEVLRKTAKNLYQNRWFKNRQSNPVPPIQSCLHHDTAASSEVWEELGWETRPRQYAFVF
jgi:hypothetical protein